MSPAALVAWSAAAVSVALLTNNPVYRGLVALVSLYLLVAHHRQGSSLRSLLVILGAFGVLTTLYNPLISHGGTHVLAHIPAALPGIGGNVTLEAVGYGLSAAIGEVAAALATAPLFVVLDPTELVDVVPARLGGTATALATALNLVPTVTRSFQRVWEAERLRGGGRRGLGAIRGLLVPVTLSTIEASITLAEAMDARAYASGVRVPGARSDLTRRDLAALAGAVAALLGILVLRLVGAPLDWYPFPTLSLPEVRPEAVLACMMLGLGLIAWRRARPRA